MGDIPEHRKGGKLAIYIIYIRASSAAGSKRQGHITPG